MAIDPKDFRKVLSYYPTGICVAAAVEHGGERVGVAVGSFMSVSLSPALVGFLLDKSSTTWPRIEKVGRFCVNVLAEDQEWICRRFAVRGGDKFAGISHRLSDGGQPILDGVVAWIDCMLHDVHDAGDHVIVLGEVQALSIENDCHPLLFIRGGYGRVYSDKVVGS